MQVGMGCLRNNLYYLSDSAVDAPDVKVIKVNNISAQTSTNDNPVDKYTLWHNRLGHIPDSKMKMIPILKSISSKQSRMCLICPMSKFTKLP